MSERWVLAIDFGTSFTSAAMVVNGRVEVLEIDGVRRLPSAVLWLEDELVVGTAADAQRVLHPHAAERNPKRYLGVRKNLLLGGHPVPVVDAAGAVLAAVYAEALRRSGGVAPADVRLTHPARWPAERLDALRAAATSAGIPAVTLLAEPVAAAMHYGGNKISVGEYVGVYDLGGGTFDTAILRRVDGGFELAGPPGGDDRLGGEDFDHRLMDFVIARLAVTEADCATALRESDDIQWKKAASQVLVEARLAKEALSRQTSYTMLLPPPINQEMRITRPEFEALIRADVQRTIEEFSATVEAAELEPTQLAARYLAGGSSRIPLVSRLLQEAFDAAPDTYDDPKVAVALGAAQAADRGAPEEMPQNGAGSAGAAVPIVARDEATIEGGSPLETTGIDVLGGAAVAAMAASTSNTPPVSTAPAPPPPAATRDDTVETVAPPPPSSNGGSTTSSTVLTAEDAPAATAPVEKRRSDPKTRRLAFILGAALFVLAIATVVLITRASSDSAPKPTATLVFPSQNVGFAQMERTWEVTDGELEGTLTFAGSGPDAATGRHNEAFPKSMVANADQITSDPAPTQVVRADPILGYDVAVPAGATASITYRIDVPDDTDSEDLTRWQDEARVELDAFNAEVNKKPALVISEPTDQSGVGVPELLFKGTTDPGATIDINGWGAPVNTDGTWSHLSTEMTEGPNTYVVTATGANGQKTSVTLTVSYTPPAPVAPVAPPRTGTNTGGSPPPEEVGVATDPPPATPERTTAPQGTDDKAATIPTPTNSRPTDPIVAYDDTYYVYPCWSGSSFNWISGLNVLQNDSGPYNYVEWNAAPWGSLSWDTSFFWYQYAGSADLYWDSFTYRLTNTSTGQVSNWATVYVYVDWYYC